jgi:Ca-activated chloride channel family protein
MAERDFRLGDKPMSRLEAAKLAFRQFLRSGQGTITGEHETLPDSPAIAHTSSTDDGLVVGLLTFAARAEDVCPPTLSHAVVLRMLDAAQPVGAPPDSSTNIGDAIIQGLELARKSKTKEKALVLLSDGEHNVPNEVVPNARRPRQAAQLAKALGIRIHTIFVGPATSADPDTAANAAKGEQALRDVAAITAGQAFRAGETTSLLAVCREIDQLERTRLESFQFYRYQEIYPWLGMGCLVIIMGLALGEGTRWFRVP